MDGYQFTSAIFQSLVSLAWPAAVFGSVYLFRDKLKELLPLLRAKHKEFEISFRLEQAEKEAAALAPIPETPETQPTAEEKGKFEELAELSPRAAILELRYQLKEAVRTFAAHVGVDLSSRTTTLGGLTRLLRNNELIDQNTSALLDDLRALGNTAAHSSDAVLSKDDAMRFGALAETLIKRLTIASGAAELARKPAVPTG